MAFAKGFGTLTAAVKGTTWGTPVLLGAGHAMEYTNESIAMDSQLIDDDQVSGQATTMFGDKGNELHSGEHVAALKYQGLDLLLGLAFGTAEAPVQQGADPAYLHVFKLLKDKEGLFATYAIDKIVDVWEYPSAKVNGVKISCAQGGRASAAFPLILSSLNRNTGGGTNNNTTKSTWTLPTAREFVRFGQLAIRINAQGGGALGSSDLVYPSEFTLDIDNAMPADDVTTKYPGLIEEPVQDGFTKVTGTLKFTKYYDGSNGNANLFAAAQSKARQKMDVVWTGPALGGSGYKLALYFPDVQFTAADANVPGPQRVPVNITFAAKHVLAIPTGFPATYTGAVTAQLINGKNTNAITGV